ncbi:MAG: class I SAM-dependent methyltransferase [Acidobacteriaceae bacterium]|nr:class I SAM-dependent methyltransferase [Acidobacteriaceae bacterium]MBV9499270.1 class I SAM-dependent methyltransferase [Acidobacteriaceae bacterium]
MNNADRAVIEAFGQEWSKFDYSHGDLAELRTIFELYFGIFPWEMLPPDAVGFDLGCGSGRWAYFVAPRVGKLYCIDASPTALEVARGKLARYDNCEFHCAPVHAIPLPDNSADFAYSLGVLHHVPDTQRGIDACVRKLKPGAPFLLYLYYAFDNRPWWFRAIWRVSDGVRRVISHFPFPFKSRLCDGIALLVYWPLARIAKLTARLGLPVDHLPLAAYRERTLYVIRSDALDRFGTRLEQRFTRIQIAEMMHNSGLRGIRFSDSPCWCAVGYKR